MMSEGFIKEFTVRDNKFCLVLDMENFCGMIANFTGTPIEKIGKYVNEKLCDELKTALKEIEELKKKVRYPDREEEIHTLTGKITALEEELYDVTEERDMIAADRDRVAKDNCNLEFKCKVSEEKNKALAEEIQYLYGFRHAIELMFGK